VGLSLSKALLNILYNNPADAFTVDELLKFKVVRTFKPKRNTVLINLKRHLGNGFIEKMHLADGATWAYRVLKPAEAIAFIRGDDSKPWLKVPPNPPRVTFEIQNRHRVTYLVHLSKDDLEATKRTSEYRPNRRNGGAYLLKRKEFTLAVNAISGKGQIWLFNGWDAAVRRAFSAEFHQTLAKLVEGREGQEHFSVPVEYMNHKIRVGGSYLHLCGSHYPFEIDICGPEKDENKVKAVRMMVDQLEFNKVLLQIRDDLNALLAKNGAVEENLMQLAKNQADIVQVLNNGNGTNGSDYKPQDRAEPDPAIGTW